MTSLIRKKAMFPSRVRRFCTQELKVKPLFGHLFDRADATGRPVVNTIGIRAAESQARSKMPEWDGHSSRRGAFDIWRPLIRWKDEDVIDIHQRHGLIPNPLYFAGASRVGCWPCIYARKSEIKFIAERDPARIDEIAALEDEITIAADARAAAKGITKEPPRTWFAGRSPAAGQGRSGAERIRDVVEWSKTARGGRQLLLIDEPDPEGGCVRWGMCEHPEISEGDE